MSNPTNDAEPKDKNREDSFFFLVSFARRILGDAGHDSPAH
jgi:hypothetical protein